MSKLPTRWKDYRFPEWVPVAVRKEIRSFWAEKWGRGPHAWKNGTEGDPCNEHPLTGAKVRCKLPLYKGRTTTGWWVPAWNNMGRLVTAKGAVYVVSTCDIVKENGAK